MGGINPAVHAPAHVVDHRVRVTGAEVGVELRALVSDVVAVRVFEQPDVRCRANDDAVLVKDEAGGELEFVCKDLLRIHDAIAVRVGEDGDPVLGFAVIDSRNERSGILPRLNIGLAEPVGILGRFNDPEAAFIVPVDVHGVVDQRLTGDQRDVELRVDFEVLWQILWARDTAFDVAEGVAEFVRLAEFVDTITLSGPGDASEDHRADAVVGEIRVPVTGNMDKGAVAFAAAFDGVFIGPDLRLDVVNVDALLLGDVLGGALLSFLVALAAGIDGLRCVGCRENVGLGQDVHVVVDLVFEVEVADVLRDRVVAIREVEAHRRFEPFGRTIEVPRAADDRLVPTRIARDGTGVNHDQTTAALEEVKEVLALLTDGDIARFLRVQDEHVGVGELFSGGELQSALTRGTTLFQHRLPLGKKLGEVVGTGTVGFLSRTDENPERVSSEGRVREDSRAKRHSQHREACAAPKE